MKSRSCWRFSVTTGKAWYTVVRKMLTRDWTRVWGYTYVRLGSMMSLAVSLEQTRENTFPKCETTETCQSVVTPRSSLVHLDVSFPLQQRHPPQLDVDVIDALVEDISSPLGHL